MEEFTQYDNYLKFSGINSEIFKEFSEWFNFVLCTIFFCGVCFSIWSIHFLPLEFKRNLTDRGYNHLLESKSNKKNKIDLINRERRLRKIGSKIPPPFPNGWFAIAESRDVAAGKAISVNCLGQNFVVFRSEEGEVHILDAYCPHLGANLGIGGTVKNDCIQCPFHQWSFRGTDGQCVNIPYSTGGEIPKQAKVDKWTSMEFGGFIFVWHHVEDTQPWSIPRIQEVDSEQWVYHGRNEFIINSHIQEIGENGADSEHFFVTHVANIFTGTDLRNLENCWSFLGKHSWQTEWHPATESDLNHVAHISLKHQFHLFNKLKMLAASTRVKQIGPGYMQLFVTSSFGTVFIQFTITPIEPMVQKIVQRCYGPRHLGLFAKFALWGESVQFERDIMLWNNKKYFDSPCLVKEDRQIKDYRKWYRQFYSDNSTSYTDAKENFEW